MRTKFLIFDGVDEVGKSTFIETLKMNPEVSGKVVELNFPKLLPSGKLLRINDEKSFELLFSVFDYLDPQFTYILDRFITSNLVYDKVLRDEDVTSSLYYWNQFLTRFNVQQYIFTRPPIDHDFVDDKIKMSKDKFNGCIEEYKKYGVNHMLLVRNQHGQVTGVDTALKAVVTEDIVSFIRNG